MELTSSQVENVPVLHVSGEIDHGTAPHLQGAIEGQLEEGSRFLLLDLQSVDYIDSGGIAVLLTTLRRLRDLGWLGVIAPTTGVRRLLDMVGLTIDRGFKLFGDPEEARLSILGQSPAGSYPAVSVDELDEAPLLPPDMVSDDGKPEDGLPETAG